MFILPGERSVFTETELLTKISVIEGKTMYGYSMQALYGDNKNKEPSVLDFIKWNQWDAWMEREGMTKAECMKEFLNYAIPILKKWGHATEDPQKPIFEMRYNKCI